MRANLDTLCRDIVADLQGRGLVVFKCHPRSPELLSEAIFWNTETAPDYREFIAAAEAAGARIVTIFSREFSTRMVEDALDQLAPSAMDRETRRSMESRIRDLRPYEGFICEIELSFTHDGRTYIFDQLTDWFEEVNELIGELEDAYQTVDQDTPLGGYYSNN